MAPTSKGHSGHVPPSTDRRALVVSGWLTGSYFVVELVIGLWTGSVAVTSDAFHTFSAVGGVLIALVAMRLAERKSTPARTFGYTRAEILGALFNGLFLVLMALFVFGMGAMRLMDPIELPTTPMLWAAAGGIATELVALRLLYQRQKGNLNMRGAFWHVMQTFVGSFLIIISALVIRFTGFLAIDPLLGMAFGVVLLWASWGILKESLHILLQGTPEDVDLDAAISAIGGLDGVIDVHHVHAWSLTSGLNIFSSHVRVQDASTGQHILTEVSNLLRDRFNIYFSTIQIEELCLSGEDRAAAIDVGDLSIGSHGAHGAHGA
ncbi:MAG TPA: zinc ABC transporter [Erythrobacter sp.]|jgi:cobalt-zinc-cadmium efflux system protein|uniref:Cation diffusion facilitator family transporter n=1 Tax=Qipengyuania citrea TaxID=225971 RepID=A0A6I4UGD5_9SPHN|nr:cation diffusion facilitator family transporter [Qipengyuania citrea]MAG99095.1 zinc ABC transporter [Rhodospirillaceae bacterium]HAW36795.1 zinc ABC transporter [Erythrobacter sp.]MCD1591018.1 cation diffusion facilitator family transporter [Qipengyuania citrea]MDQ0567097.1 cobalt-zinc-cadmium efflux system protein [Qipengyuania citrea]MXP36565.1 cation diffusion facilitator family transporter [Qipengyuania citrea]|tara:strand:- start:5134 stop:6096 length:963 start_codon:yes stop_codon:yes gene_type:complete